MLALTGLFTRGGSYYLRVVLAQDHPARSRYQSGRIVASLGTTDRREAVRRGLVRRAQLLSGTDLPAPARPAQAPALASDAPAAPLHLRGIFTRWTAARPRNPGTVGAVERAVTLFEQCTGDPPIATLTRAVGVDFRAWLQEEARGTTSKTARDRFTWAKSLLRYAHRDLEAIPRNPWEGLDIEARTTHRRRPWRPEEVRLLLAQPLHARYELPRDPKAGGAAAYWLPLMGLYTGARISELAQLRRRDIVQIDGVAALEVTDDGAGQQVKTQAGIRCVPIHSELIRLGLLDYVASLGQEREASIWPALPMREGKPGGFFSQWFGNYRRSLGFDRQPDFHSLRHTVRTILADADVAEPIIDKVLGHQIQGSTGARVYTHRSIHQLRAAIERISYPAHVAPRVFSPAGKPAQISASCMGGEQ